MNVRFVDSHLHLSDFRNSGGVVLSAASTKTRLLSCGVDRESSDRTVGLARKNPTLVSAFVGLHPSKASNQQEVGWLNGLLEEASGVGEIGLDSKYSDAGELSPQMRLFTEQLAIAEAAGKPVQVHSRNAEAQCLELLGTHRIASALLHWFNGESELGRAEQKGYFVSFGPALLQSRKLQRIASRYSLDLILVESDWPVTFSWIGGAGGPSTVPSVLFKLAELRGSTFEEMVERTARNASAYLPSIGKVNLPTDSGLHRKIGQD